MSSLVDRLFVLLAEYANASGTTKMNVNELNQHLFKAVVSILRQAPDELLTKRRLQILLNHVETDLLDPHKQSTAFVLAKAIINRGLQSEKVDDLVKYLAELSVTSPIEQTRAQSRATIQTYFRSHPDGKSRVERWLRFFIDQLDYEFIHGRVSAYESIYALFRLFNEVCHLLAYFNAIFRMLWTNTDFLRLFVSHHDLSQTTILNVMLWLLLRLVN
jgi:hypothetical protein